MLPAGRIRLELQVEVSEFDFRNNVEVNGSAIPGLTTRRVNTSLLADPGQTILVGGHLSDEASEQVEGQRRLAIAVTPVLLDDPPRQIADQSESNSSEAHQPDPAGQPFPE